MKRGKGVDSGHTVTPQGIDIYSQSSIDDSGGPGIGAAATQPVAQYALRRSRRAIACMVFGLVALVTALLLLAGASALAVHAFEPENPHRAMLLVAIVLMGMLALLATGLCWLGIHHGYRTLYRIPFRAV